MLLVYLIKIIYANSWHRSDTCCNQNEALILFHLYQILFNTMSYQKKKVARIKEDIIIWSFIALDGFDLSKKQKLLSYINGIDHDDDDSFLDKTAVIISFIEASIRGQPLNSACLDATNTVSRKFRADSVLGVVRSDVFEYVKRKLIQVNILECNS